MRESSAAPIAVAVPHDGVESALRFAAREALVHGCPVRVTGPPGTCPGQPPDFVRRAAALVELLAGPGVPVDLCAEPADDVEDVLAICRDAALVVVHRSQLLGLLHALSYGAYGARALTNVACVPEDWSPTYDDRRPVVVGVDDPFHAEALLATGMEDARIHDTWLKVVHAWYLPYRLGAEKDQRLGALWTEELDRLLESQLSAIGSGEVRSLVEVRRGAPAEVVLGAAGTAQQLLLGRNATSSDHLCHLGRTARTAIREHTCPVVLLARGDAAS